MPLTTSGHWFIDNQGRKVLLRGVNLGGSNKIPYNNSGTHIETDFSDHREVSFVNRPFPLEDADEHFQRLQSWGFNTLRLLTTWEAIEHQGPGQYDTEYLDYFTKIVEIAGDYGFYVFIDPHQDVWSRMTGGDGAPGWTFEKVGLDFTTFANNGAAKVMQYHYPDDYQQMEWFLNYGRFATATMFTLFFGSEDFAPNTTIEGVSAQTYLQSHFIDSIAQIAERVKDFDHVIGFDSLNEPHGGFIGIPDLTQFPDQPLPGLMFSPFDAIAAGSGYPREVKWYRRFLFWIFQTSTKILNPEGISSWIKPEYDVWMNHDVFSETADGVKIDNPGYFATTPDGSKANFENDYLRPFARSYIEQIREIIPDTLLFIEGDPSDPVLSWKSDDPKGVVNASHWYDGFTLFTKSYKSWITGNVETRKPIFLAKNVRKYHTSKLQKLRDESDKIHGGVPTLVGEFGIPYDMNNKKAYSTGDFSSQINALSSYYDILDELQYHSTQWNYTADNNNQWGDLWNLEDLSIFSYDQQKDPNDINSGGRAVEGFVRPFPIKTAGSPINWKFDRENKRFELEFDAKSSHGRTEVFVPKIQFKNPQIRIDPTVEFELNREKQILSIVEYDGKIKVIIKD